MTITDGKFGRAVAACAAVALVAACAQTPAGSTVQVMPGPGKSFDAFASDQSACKFFASTQVKGQADAANQRAIGTAALTTLLGAGFGAAVGAATGNAAAGAAIGASTGVAGGSAVAAGNGENDQAMIQVQYDNAYAQCMYSKGNQVPGFAPAVAQAGGVQYSGPDPALVQSVQSELVRLNYLAPPADGILGPHTSSAISSFEQNAGLPVDGTVSHRLLTRLEATASGSAAPAAAPAPAAPADWVSPAVAAQPPAPQGWVAPSATP